MSDTRFEMTRWAELERSLKRRFDACPDTATPSTILLAVLNAVADANLYAAGKSAPDIGPQRRERIATAAMQGMIGHRTGSAHFPIDEVAKDAVRAADALIAELAKEPQR